MTRKHTFPAGEYYIGDPCYIIPDEDWMPLLERTAYFGLPNHSEPSLEDWDDGVFHWDGRRCFVAGTKWGDGCYGNEKGDKVVGVDSGTIAIIPLKEGDSDNDKDGLPFLYSIIVSYGKRFQVWEEDGVFHFGSKVKINTK